MLPFYKKYLYINLSDETYTVVPIEDSILEEYGGGKGIGTYLLYTLNPQGADPFSEDNHLIINAGPATDRKVWGSSRYAIYTKSPLTNCYLDSTAGGKLARPLSRTGYDAIVIKGKSDKPIFLEISDKNVVFHNAESLWGKDAYYTENKIKEEINVRGAEACVIGPAGENMVKFAAVKSNYWRSIGRGGVGAVFGSKKLKGIVFYGEAKRSAGNPDKLDELFKELKKKDRDNKGYDKYKRLGTASGVELLNKVKAFPTRYWHKGVLEGWENITPEKQMESAKVRPMACPNCYIACTNVTVTSPESKYPNLTIEGPEYETLYVFGGLCCITDIEDIIHLNNICDKLGMDTMTGGNIVAFVMEASFLGKTDKKYEYGDVKAAEELLYNIAYSRGIGQILKEGIVPASKHFGLEDIAIHVKGMEPAGYDPRILKGTALGYAVSPRGACHLRSGFYKAELSGVIDPDTLDGKSELLVDWEDRFCMFDTLILCRFYRDTYFWDEIVSLFQALYDDETITKEVLREKANKIITLTKKFNLRENPDRIDELEKLPKRLFKEPLNGKVIVEDEFNYLLQRYYSLRGWDDKGIPKKLFMAESREIEELLERVPYGVVSFIDGGKSRQLPVNFVYLNKAIYFHGSDRNRHFSVLKHNNSVSFSAFLPLSFIPSYAFHQTSACSATQFFESVLIDGHAEFVVKRTERITALTALMQKLQPEGKYKSLYSPDCEKILDNTSVIRIIPKNISAKFKLGQKYSKDKFNNIIDYLKEKNNKIGSETIMEMQKYRNSET